MSQSSNRFVRRRRRVVAAVAVAVVVAAVAAVGLGALDVGDGGVDAPSLAAAAQDAPRYVTEPGLRPPAVTIHSRSGELADGVILLGAKRPSSTDRTGPLIVDDAGRPIWFRQNAKGIRANDVRVQEYEGRPVLTWWEGRARGGNGKGVGVIADTSYNVIERVRTKAPDALDMHEFKLTDRGTALVTVYRETRRDLRSVGGARNGKILDGMIQEIDIDSGRVLFTWHSLGNIALKESYKEPPKSPNEPWDYFHPNSIDVDADGDYIVSARYTNSVTKISRRTGRIVWRLGGKRSDFRMGRGTTFVLAHDAEWRPDGTMQIFDNSELAVRNRSRVLTLRIDHDRMRVRLVRDVRHPKRVLAATQGNAEALPGGGLFVGWGSQGRWSEFDAEGELRYDAELPDGWDSYRMYRHPWKAQPDTPPAVAARRADNGGTRVYASWNGATEVRSWRVLTGPSAGSLSPVSAGERKDFETVLTIPGRPARVAVQALDASGQVLGTSQAVSVKTG